MSMIITLDSKKIDTAKLNTKKVVKLIEKSIKGFIISDDDNTIIIKSKTDSINDLYKVKEKVKDIFVCGIKGMKQVIPIKRDEEHVIVTSGSNIKEVFKLDFVDKTRTISNDIFEVESYFGVEAARQLIIDEINKVLDGQGIPVDVRHIMLVADTMTMSGRVLGINRYGIVKEKPSVLARASFETPIKHLISAALTGERDELNSVIENVMLNQVVPVGTGLPQLITRKIDPSLLAAVKKEHSKEEKLKSVTKKETKEEVAEKKPVKETKATVKKTAEKKTATKTVAKKATTKKTTKKVAAKK